MTAKRKKNYIWAVEFRLHKTWKPILSYVYRSDALIQCSLRLKMKNTYRLRKYEATK